MKTVTHLCLYLVCIFWFNSSWAQASEDIIPFQLSAHNNIVIPATLNHSDQVQLMLHTAANAVTIISQSAKKAHSLHWIKTDEVTSWGGKQAARYSENNTLQLGGNEWANISIWENEQSGHETDGKFGLQLFEGKIIEFDFDQKRLMLHDTLPEHIQSYEQLPLIIQNGMLFIEATIGTTGQNHTHKLLLHTGYSGCILLNDDFVNNSHIDTAINITHEQELRDAYGNVLTAKKGTLPTLVIGSETLEQLPVGFFEGSVARQKMSVIGTDILKRFNLIIDIDNQHLYLKPNQLMSLPFNKG